MRTALLLPALILLTSASALAEIATIENLKSGTEQFTGFTYLKMMQLNQLGTKPEEANKLCQAVAKKFELTLGKLEKVEAFQELQPAIPYDFSVLTKLYGQLRTSPPKLEDLGNFFGAVLSAVSELYSSCDDATPLTPPYGGVATIELLKGHAKRLTIYLDVEVRKSRDQVPDSNAPADLLDPAVLKGLGAALYRYEKEIGQLQQIEALKDQYPLVIASYEQLKTLYESLKTSFAQKDVKAAANGVGDLLEKAESLFDFCDQAKPN